MQTSKIHRKPLNLHRDLQLNRRERVQLLQSGVIPNSRLRETVKPECKLEWGVAGDSRNRPLNQLFTTLAHCG